MEDIVRESEVYLKRQPVLHGNLHADFYARAARFHFDSEPGQRRSEALKQPSRLRILHRSNALCPSNVRRSPANRPTDTIHRTTTVVISGPGSFPTLPGTSDTNTM